MTILKKSAVTLMVVGALAIGSMAVFASNEQLPVNTKTETSLQLNHECTGEAQQVRVKTMRMLRQGEKGRHTMRQAQRFGNR